MMATSKKWVLCVSFLIALLPVFLEWFDIGGGAVRPPWLGIFIMRLDFYLAVVLYELSLYVEKRWGMIGANLLAITSYFTALSRFPIRTNIASVQLWKYTMGALRWTFWAAVLVLAAHLLFVLLMTRRKP